MLTIISLILFLFSIDFKKRGNSVGNISGNNNKINQNNPNNE